MSVTVERYESPLVRDPRSVIERQTAIDDLAGRIPEVFQRRRKLPIDSAIEIISRETKAPRADVHLALGRLTVLVTGDGFIELAH